MKSLLRILLAISVLLACTEAFAQYVPEWHQGDLTKKGTRIAVLDEKLDRETTLLLVESVGGPEMAADWQKYARNRGWGIGLTSGGYTLAVAGLCYGGVYMVAGLVGTIFAAIGGQEAVDKLWADLGPRVYIGSIAMATGIAAGTTGVILLSRSNRRLKDITRTCDAAGLPPVDMASGFPSTLPSTLPSTDSPTLLLTFGPTPSGVGLALRF